MALSPLRSVTYEGRWVGPPTQHLSWGLFPFDASSSLRQVIPELPTPGSRHVGFFTFARLTLRSEPLQPYFMPVAPMGLHPSELFPLEEPYTSRCQVPSCRCFP
jgi:hypothetical protein